MTKISELKGHGIRITVGTSAMRRSIQVVVMAWLAVGFAPLNAQTAEDYFKKALDEQNSGNLELAIADYDRAIALNPNDATPYYNRGKAKRAKQDLDGAVADYDRAIALDPNYAPAYNNRGTAKHAKQDLDGAVADYDRAIALDPNYAIAYYNRGNAKRAKQDLDGTIADYDRAIVLNPDYATAYYNRGNAKYAKQDIAGAIADYDHFIALNPNYVPAYNNRGNAKEARGDFAGARADYIKYIAIDPKDSTYVRFYLALVLRRQGADETPAGLAAAVAAWDNGWTKTVGQFVTGVTVESDFLNQAAAGDPKSVPEHQCEAYYYAGMAHLLKGDSAKASDFFQKCVATGLTNKNELFLAKGELAKMH